MRGRKAAAALSLALVALAGPLPVAASADFITLASTTSTEGSGLLAYLLPLFSAQAGIEVRVVAVGTGHALSIGRSGDCDVLLVHDRAGELEFMQQGYGSRREIVMSNDFVIVGPASDSVGIRGLVDASEALTRIAAAQARFVSRGDDSGTHRAELRLWRTTNTDPRTASGTWYREVGQGMGATLNTTAGMDGYTLTDRASWLRSENRGSLELLVEGDTRLENVYGAILIDPKRHPHVKVAAAERFIDWLVSQPAQLAIARFELRGRQAYRPRRFQLAPHAEGAGAAER